MTVNKIMYTLFDKELWDFPPARWRTSSFYLASTKPLDCSSRTDGLSSDKVAPNIPGSNTVWSPFMGTRHGFGIRATFAKRHGGIETTHSGGSCICYSGHAWMRVAWDETENQRLRCDKRGAHRVSVNSHTNFHSSSTKQGIYNCKS